MFAVKSNMSVRVDLMDMSSNLPNGRGTGASMSVFMELSASRNSKMPGPMEC